MNIANGLQYLWMIVFIMIVAGIAKENNLFNDIFSLLRKNIKSNRAVVAIISAVSGVLPIEGRVTVSAGVLDTICSHNTQSRQKMGTLDYLSTHHYYLWSPLEKTVILPIAAFGLTYLGWLSIIWPILVLTLAYVTFFIFTFIKESDINISLEPVGSVAGAFKNVLPFITAIGTYIYFGGENNVFVIFGLLASYYIVATKTFDIKKLFNFIDFKVVAMIATVIILGNIFKMYEGEYKSWLQMVNFDLHSFVSIAIFSLIGFAASFLMGSSGKYIAFAVLVSQLVGIEYFLWFFTVDYVAYLLSPTHKCVMIGNRYFNTPIKSYYQAIGIWCLLMLLLSGLITFL